MPHSSVDNGQVKSLSPEERKMLIAALTGEGTKRTASRQSPYGQYAGTPTRLDLEETG